MALVVMVVWCMW